MVGVSYELEVADDANECLAFSPALEPVLEGPDEAGLGQALS